MHETPRAGGDAVLAPRDYDAILGVLEDVDGRRTVTAFREGLLNALASKLGMRHSTFFLGPSLATTWMDPAPTLAGEMPSGMLDDYLSRWYRHDVFRSRESRRMIESSRVATLAAVRNPTLDETRYLRDFLNRNGFFSGHAFVLEVAGSLHGIVGVFGRSESDNPREREMLRRLVGPLNAMSRSVRADALPTSPGLTGKLAPRHREVALRIADGLSNREIAQQLSLSDDTVKKYVSAVLDALRCSSRTQAALIIRDDLASAR